MLFIIHIFCVYVIKIEGGIRSIYLSAAGSIFGLITIDKTLNK